MYLDVDFLIFSKCPLVIQNLTFIQNSHLPRIFVIPILSAFLHSVLTAYRLKLSFSLHSNLNNPVIFSSLYYLSDLNSVKGFSLPAGLTFCKTESNFMIELNSSDKKVSTPFKRWFCNRRIGKISV